MDVASALARHARQGRDLRWAVIGWYAQAGRQPFPGGQAVPEPPWPAVREALLWAMERSRMQRLMTQARTGGERQQDAFYADAERALAHGPAGMPDPDQVRRQLQDGADLVPMVRGLDAARRRAGTHLMAASAMGADEIGSQVLVETLRVLMPDLSTEALAAAAEQAETDGTLGTWAIAGAYDPLALLATAGEQDMARARQRAQQLAGIAGLLFFHGLLMPNTPALAALRAAFTATGLAPLLQLMMPQMLNPTGVPHALATCLTPAGAQLADLVEALLLQHAEHGLLTGPGSQHPTAEAYMAAWLDALDDALARTRTASPEHGGPAGA
ncbi:hypothetical protein [Streptomyces sp. NPDC051219]|uniref:hypothetical protein n=1 Tax=Streptomyces sp. NPDC051219 TaxID=3155283 RepID=UPI0034329FBD